MKATHVSAILGVFAKRVALLVGVAYRGMSVRDEIPNRDLKKQVWKSANVLPSNVFENQHIFQLNYPFSHA